MNQKGTFGTLYCYDLSNFKSSIKVRLVYLLRGRRGEKGMVQKLNGKFFSQGSFFIPEKNIWEMDEVLNEWGVKYKHYEIQIFENKRRE